ncbi:MAG: HK97 gp10 family phage protein [Staphylococcus rostri]|uniref:HK97-gp10 family putative phage morphogenesis protein n=1 Tax=Staphylococcus rostri TaxID=522262 RepID=UPI0026DED34A|nr:HK97-gp10 family putative phage morphogenesis protein [Staphylococcus rostri]MDO5375693.1 HK97 gp10 family phage protein [Staphylococcus rostri]
MGNSITRGLRQYKQKVLNEARQGVAETTALLHAESSSRAPVDTGALKNSIDMSISGYHGRVSVGSRYALYLEFGTGIYATKGSRAKKIPWSYFKNGKWYTTYGMVAQPFWYPSVDEARKYFKSYFNG